mmetsp:Transcript_810/g.1626  ORF Transcript_810/g.1626 Transcript_810/m.1626 type:complete len:204 (+) Transcript_810:912-1523(+)
MTIHSCSGFSFSVLPLRMKFQTPSFSSGVLGPPDSFTSVKGSKSTTLSMSLSSASEAGSCWIGGWFTGAAVCVLGVGPFCGGHCCGKGIPSLEPPGTSNCAKRSITRPCSSASLMLFISFLVNSGEAISTLPDAVVVVIAKSWKMRPYQGRSVSRNFGGRGLLAANCIPRGTRNPSTRYTALVLLQGMRYVPSLVTPMIQNSP